MFSQYWLENGKVGPDLEIEMLSKGKPNISNVFLGINFKFINLFL